MVQRHFYWPSFHKDVEKYCASCELCAKNKVVPMPRSPMKPIEVKPQPFYIVGVDIIGNREDHEIDVVDERPYNLRRNRRTPERYGISIMAYQLYNCTIVAEMETLTNAETLTLCYKEERKKRTKKYCSVDIRVYRYVLLLYFDHLDLL